MEIQESPNLKIAIVDDEKDLGVVFSRALQQLGYPEPSTFSNGTALVRAIMNDRQSYDVILIDYRMPEMNGIEAAKVLKRYKPETKIIIMSGYDFVKDRAREIGLPFIAKPFEINQLDECLKNGVE